MGVLRSGIHEKGYYYNINNASNINPWHNYYSSKAQIGFAIFTIRRIKNEKEFI